MPGQVGPNPFTFGGLTFATVDCPTELVIGTGEQSMAIQKTVGGGKVIHTTGFHPGTNTWRGTFHQPDIETNVATLTRFNVDGRERLATWKGQHYYGVVKAFIPKHRKGGNLVDWQLDVEISRAANGAFSPAGAAPSADAQISSLSDTVNVSAAAIQAGSASLSASTQALNATFASQLTNANLAISAATPTANAPATVIQSALTAVAAALGAASTLSAVLGAGSAPALSLNQAIAALTVISALLKTSQAQGTHQQQGGTVFETAVSRYGDLSRAYDLMRANGIVAGRLPGDVLSVYSLLPIASK